MNELYEKCLQQEKELVFESVTQEDMIRLGWTLYENNKKFAGPLAILIKINEKTVFHVIPMVQELFMNYGSKEKQIWFI